MSEFPNMTPFKRQRLAAGLTQKALAEKLGTDESNVTRWEAGDSMPNPKYYPKLAEVFGMSAMDVTFLFSPAQPQA